MHSRIGRPRPGILSHLVAIACLILGQTARLSAQTEAQAKEDPESRRRQLIATAKDIEQDKRFRRSALFHLEEEGGRGQPWFKDLLLSLLGHQERNPRVTETAIQMLVQGWGPGKDDRLKQHLLDLATNQKRWDELRTTAIKALGSVWGRDEEIKGRLVLLAGPQEPDEKVRATAMGTLADAWGAQDWLKQSLLQWASPQEKARWARMHAILTLGRAWPRDPPLKNLLLTYATSTTEHWDINSAALEALGKAWGAQDWLKDLLLPLAGPEQKDPAKQGYALYAVAEFFGPQPWVKDLLLPLAASPQEEMYLRIQCTQDIVRLWGQGREEWLKDLLVSIVIAPEGGAELRYPALNALLDVWAKEQTEETEHGRDATKVKGKAADELPWLKTLLLQLSAAQEKDTRIRMQSLWALCNVWEREPWLKAVLQSAEKDDSLREMAIAQLKKF